jgi:16S rRNA processing protein RimM
METLRRASPSLIIARGSVNDVEAMEALKRAVGGGLGKHGQKEKRAKVNKYANAVKAPAVDPMEETVAASKKYEEEQVASRRRKFGQFESDEDDEDAEYDAEEEAAEEAAYLAEEEARYLAEEAEGGGGEGLNDEDGAETRAEAARAARKSQRSRKSFPDNARIDPYDPTTFGFVYLGAVLGAHGLNGELKVRVLSDFGAERLGKGAKLHLKEPRRRFPKEHKVSGGRPAGGAASDTWLVKLQGVRSREEAAKLQGNTLFVWRDDRSQALARSGLPCWNRHASTPLELACVSNCQVCVHD